MDFLLSLTLTVHNLWRWVVLAIGVVAIIKFAIGWLGSRPWQDIDRQLASGYAGAMTVQFVLGIILLLLYAIIGAFNPAKQIEHAVYGLLALALAHMTAMFKNRPDKSRFLGSMLLIIGSLLMVLFSVWRLRGSALFGLM
jgi:drug/metabolite transporter superfamily protein YnfA